MASALEEQRRPHKRRSTMRAVNYSEKDADMELAKSLQRLEKGSGSKPKGHAGRPKKETLNGTGNGSQISSRSIYDKSLYWNFIPTIPPSYRKNSRFSTILDLDDAMVDLKGQILVNNNVTLLAQNETIYMVSEPPGDPYYIGRIVEFTCKPEFKEQIDSALVQNGLTKFPARFFQLQMNWFYRPRDIQEKTNNVDPRLLYASLHQDICPIPSYRGKCTVLHYDEVTSETSNLKDFYARPSVFYFKQLFDRYTLKYYNVVLTKDLLKKYNKSSYLYALNKRFKYIFAEEKFPLEPILRKYVLQEKRKLSQSDDNSWDERCVNCKEWCFSVQSLKCDECGVSIHLYCMDPPLDRKPNKGVVWLCYACMQRAEGTPEAIKEAKEEELADKQYCESQKRHINDVANQVIKDKVKYNKENCWFQYLGYYSLLHMEDALLNTIFQPYPFKTSRTGMRYQWSGCNDSHPWVAQPYLEDANARGGQDNESDLLLWKFDKEKITESELNAYIAKCKRTFPPSLNIQPESCNFLDMILQMLMQSDYNTTAAMELCKLALSRDSLREPSLTAEEIEKFENAVAKYGSELHLVCKSVETQPMSMIVRYYYYWKKTPNGRRIWGNFKGRNKNKDKIDADTNSNSEKNKHTRDRKPSRLALESTEANPDIEWKHVDDSSFDVENYSILRSYFKCMFCEVDYSPMWYKVTGGSDDDNIKARMQTGVNEKTERSNKLPRNSINMLTDENSFDALCIRCARLWRRYATPWQHPLEVLKKLNGTSTTNLHNCMDEMIEETNPNEFVLSPEQAYHKNVEWELAQDSELISRQRIPMIEDVEQYLKVKKRNSTGRPHMQNMVRKEVDKGLLQPARMKRDLDEYLSKNIKRPSTRKPETKSKEKTKESKANASVSKENVNGKVNGRKPLVKDKMKDKTSTVQIDDSYKKHLSTNGDFIININKSGIVSGKITMDTSLETIQLDSDIKQSLMSYLISKKRKGEDLDEAQKRHKSNMFIYSENNDATLKHEIKNPITKNNIPIVIDSCRTKDMLTAYHSYTHGMNNSKLHNHHGHSKVPKKSVSVDANSHEVVQLKCFICLSESHSEYIIKCHNCGLAVHYQCYGIQIPEENIHENKELSKYQWLCDACSNDLNPIVSTSYHCCLCYSRENMIDLHKVNKGKIFTDALKVTTNGSWAHILCALFTNEIYFGDTETLQPIVNASYVLKKNKTKSCCFCKLSGGAMVSCDICGENVHVTCAQDSEAYRLAFKKTGIKPTMLCSSHISEPIESQYVLFQDTNTDLVTSSLLHAIRSQSKDLSNESLVRIRYLEQKSTIEDRNMFEQLQGRNFTSISNEAKRYCASCGTMESIYWHSNDNCHSCYLMLQSKRGHNIMNKTECIRNESQRISDSKAQELLAGIELAKFSLTMKKPKA